MKLKRFFRVTYFMHSETIKEKCTEVEGFWIWNAPVFEKWLEERNKEIRNKTGLDSCIVTCGII